MKNLNISAFIVLILALVLNGCSTVSAVKEVSSELEPIVTIAVEPTVDSVEITQETKDVSPVLQNVNEDELDQYSLKKGIIFAKTDFQGVLKKSYVKFLFQEQGNLSNNFQLLISGFQ